MENKKISQSVGVNGNLSANINNLVQQFQNLSLASNQWLGENQPQQMVANTSLAAMEVEKKELPPELMQIRKIGNVVINNYNRYLDAEREATNVLMAQVAPNLPDQNGLVSVFNAMFGGSTQLDQIMRALNDVNQATNTRNIQFNYLIGLMQGMLDKTKKLIQSHDSANYISKLGGQKYNQVIEDLENVSICLGLAQEMNWTSDMLEQAIASIQNLLNDLQ